MVERIEVPKFCYDPRRDVNDGEAWSEADVRDLTAALQHGSTIEEAAGHLCRAGSVEEVRAKADELGLKYRRGTSKTQT
jgi:hypothetical protein